LSIYINENDESDDDDDDDADAETLQYECSDELSNLKQEHEEQLQNITISVINEAEGNYDEDHTEVLDTLNEEEVNWFESPDVVARYNEANCTLTITKKNEDSSLIKVKQELK